jgi:plastocyanin
MFPSRLAGVSFALIFAVACGSDYSPSPTTPSPTTPSPTPAPAPGGVTSPVSIQAGAESLADRAYAPAELNVAVGTTITWTNDDTEGHTTDSDAPGWNSGIIPPRGTFSVTLQTAGTFPYHCSIHPGMVGTVIVR